jgi:hypothetical protein
VGKIQGENCKYHENRYLCIKQVRTDILTTETDLTILVTSLTNEE